VTPPEVLVISLRTTIAAVAIFGAASLLGDRALRTVGWALALFLLIAAVDSLTELIPLWGYLQDLFWIAAIATSFVYFYGPTMYLYVLTVTGKTVPRRQVTLVFGLPFVLAVVTFLALQTIPHQVQIDMLAGARIADARYIERATVIMAAMQLSFLVLTFGCIVACWLALDENLRRLSGLFSSIEDRTLAWLRWVMILIVLAWGWAALIGTLDGVLFSSDLLKAVDAAITLVWVGSLAYFGIRQRPSLQDDPAPSLSASGPVPEPEQESELTGKYARSALDKERMTKLGNRMVQLMRSQSLYRDPGLSLRGLSDRVGASPNYISQTLNDHLGVSFFDFVNGFRVEEAEHLLRGTDRSVTDIALEVGFNSRSTFNAAVRKHKGLSPSEMRSRR
jgi:AraC-like DNA-binding protein